MELLSYKIPGAFVIDHQAEVPLDWFGNSTSATINIFVRELQSTEVDSSNFPYLVYFQGGPGGKAMRPTSITGWMKKALSRYRLLLLDQRGTGRSHRISAESISRFASSSEAARYLSHFRADSIVADTEYLRTQVFKSPPWTTLGQSYGGFITLTYLSFHPEGLKKCLITGGIPSLRPSAVDVYQKTYPRVLKRNRALFQRYPHLHPLVGRVYEHIRSKDVMLPDGDLLTVERIQSLGLDLGMTGGYERILWLFEKAFGPDGELSSEFLYAIMELTSCSANPLFFVLQESIYGHGEGAPTSWAASEVLAQFPEFHPAAEVPLFTGEMVYPWMFDQVRSLAPFKGAVMEMARQCRWSKLYDLERLRCNVVPVAACVYIDDMYVDYEISAQSLIDINEAHTWQTNEYNHDGLHVSDGVVFDRLDAMSSGR
jgi:proline iminopeptidase